MLYIQMYKPFGIDFFVCGLRQRSRYTFVHFFCTDLQFLLHHFWKRSHFLQGNSLLKQVQGCNSQQGNHPLLCIGFQTVVHGNHHGMCLKVRFLGCTFRDPYSLQVVLMPGGLAHTLRIGVLSSTPELVRLCISLLHLHVYRHLYLLQISVEWQTR